MPSIIKSVSEWIEFSHEITGISLQNKETGENTFVLKGLRSQKISQKIKFWLEDALEKITPISKRLDESRKSLFKKYAVGDIIPEDKQAEATKELQEILDEAIELDIYAFSIEMFEFEDDASYPQLYKTLRQISKTANPED